MAPLNASPCFTCKHISFADVTVVADHGRTDIPGHKPLCSWIDDHTHILDGMPRWLAEWAESGGPTFTPAKHCDGCPGYCAKESG